MSPFIACCLVFAAVCLVTWVLSLITNEHSWVDRIWSIVPIVYVWIFAAAADFADPRLILMAVLVTLWGARLTFNFARKGGYRPGGEDYRWQFLRDRMKPWQFQLFNLFFITIYQNIILFLIAMPALTVWSAPQYRLGWFDFVLAALFLALLIGETVADQQQWNFHALKARLTAQGTPPSPDFLTTGLFRYSRHPNFFFEQAQWWVLAFFGVSATGSVLQWTFLGPVLLTLLFIGSTVFTERISVSRHPGYPEYQRRTSPIIPWFPRDQRSAANAAVQS